MNNSQHTLNSKWKCAKFACGQTYDVPLPKKNYAN